MMHNAALSYSNIRYEEMFKYTKVCAWMAVNCLNLIALQLKDVYLSKNNYQVLPVLNSLTLFILSQYDSLCEKYFLKSWKFNKNKIVWNRIYLTLRRNPK